MATMALTNLVMTEENQEMLVNIGGLPLLIARLGDPSAKIRMRAVWCLANLTQSSDIIRARVGAEGGIAQVVQMLLNTNIEEETRNHALKVAINCALNAEAEQVMQKAQISKLLLQYMMLNQSPKLQMLATMALVNLAQSSVIRKQIFELSGLQVISNTLLSAQTGDLQLQCTKLIGNMAMHGRSRWILKQAPQIVNALRILNQSQIPQIRQQADRTVRNLSFPCDDVDQGKVQETQTSSVMEQEIARAAALEEAKVDQMMEEQSRSCSPSVASSSAATSSGSVTHQPTPTIRTVQTKAQVQKILTDDAQEVQIRKRREAELERAEAKLLAKKQKAAAKAQKIAEQERNAQERARKEAEAKRLQEEAKAKQQEQEENYQKKRSNIAVEMLVTERTYVKSLEMMIKKYKNPMEAASQQQSKPCVSSEEIHAIFSIVDTLYTYHSMLLEGLDRRVRQWGPETQIGDYFLQMADFLRSYSDYVNNYDQAVETLTKCEERPAFKALLQKCTNAGGELKGQNIYSYLIQPIQRIPRYILLLEDLKKKTRKDHIDYPQLGKAIEKVQEIADFVDENKAFYNDAQRMLILSEEVVGLPRGEEVIQPGRVFVHEGQVKVNKAEESVYCFLFNNALYITNKKETSGKKSRRKSSSRIQTKTRYEFINMIPLQGAKLTNYKSDAFALESKIGSFHIEPSLGTKTTWINSLRKILAGTLSTQGSFVIDSK